MKSPDQYIYTRSGKKIDPTNIKPEDIDIKDIAYALAGINRYGGHSRVTVAVHSVATAWVAKEMGYDILTQQWALLHDAAEAYFGDVPRPMQMFVGGGWRMYYERCESAIIDSLLSYQHAETLHYSAWVKDEVKAIDHALVAPEMEDGPGYPEDGEVELCGELAKMCVNNLDYVLQLVTFHHYCDGGEYLFLEVAKELGIKGA